MFGIEDYPLVTISPGSFKNIPRIDIYFKQSIIMSKFIKVKLATDI